MPKTVSNEIVAHLILCKPTQPLDGGPLTAHLCALARHSVVGLYGLPQNVLTTLEPRNMKCHTLLLVKCKLCGFTAAVVRRYKD